MASEDENCEEFSGRRTRSGRKSSAPPPTPVRATRRTRKQTQEQELESENVIEEIMSDAAVEEIVNTDQSENVFYAGQQDVIEEFVTTDECQVYEEPGQELPILNEDIEMCAVPNADDKSSSFPFGVVGQSETSEDAQNEYEEIASEEVNESESAVENSLLASLVGDNANSLPSVGGNEETCSKKEDFNTKIVVETTQQEEQIQPNCEKMESDEESLSDNAIAEDIATNGNEASDATIVNTEMVSEDELPLPTKPEINDAEEVSDEELPAPKRAELPADAEVISEDELPATTATTTTTNDIKSINKSQKRKVDDDEDKTDTKMSGDEKEKSIKKTAKSDEQYNPMSPTGESNDATPPPEKKTKVESGKDTSHDKDKKKDKDKEREKEKERKKLPDLDKYWRAVKEDPADFTGWTYLLQYVDNESDAEAAREAYDAFLSHYPYCYGYWRKYADYEKRKGIKANCNAVFERGLEAIPLSVDLWIHYLAHVKSNNADNEEFIRSQFDRAVEACGLEFRSDKLWDAYIKWENDGKRYHNIVKIYDRLLAIPTQGYNGHFDNFQDLINQHSITNTLSTEEIKRLRIEVQASSRTSSSSGRSKSSHSHRSSSKEKEKEKEKDKHKEKEKDTEKDKDKDKDKDKNKENKEHKEENAIIESNSKETASHIEENSSTTTNETIAPLDVEKQENALKDLSTLTDDEICAIKDKAISVRRKLHKATVAAVTARWTYEEGIKRPYFHVKPLERCQLKNWKDYLDFEIEKGDRKRIIVLFERCLIACALYDEFWLKMIRYLESSQTQQLPDNLEITRDVFRRACQIHHPDKPSLHLMWAAFEECQNNFDGAAEILTKLENRVPNLLQIAYRRINVERRRGNLIKCRELYEHYITTAKNKTIAGSLSIKYARFLNKICNELDQGLQVLRQALEKDPANTRVALQMIDLALQRSIVDEDEVVTIMDKFMGRDGIEPEQKVLFAQRKVEFLEDFGSTAKGLQDAQRALQLALSKANEAKKKREGSPSRKQAPSANNAGFPPQPPAQSSSMYNNGSPATPTASGGGGGGGGGYNYNYYNQQQQNSAGAYPQQQSYENYYNQWQYGSGYSGYGGQWSGYGNYY